MKHNEMMHLLIDTAQSLESAAAKPGCDPESAARLLRRAQALRKAKVTFDLLNPDGLGLQELANRYIDVGKDSVVMQLKGVLGGGPVGETTLAPIKAVAALVADNNHLKDKVFMLEDQEE